MNVVERLLLREEIDALEHELWAAQSACPRDRAHIRALEEEIARLERRYLDIRRSRQADRTGAPSWN